jgi:thiamine-phosphate pyrophosphorylase
MTMFGVQFITHYTDTLTYLDSVRIALEGGCRWIQLRMKEASDAYAEEVARQAQKMCRACGAVFIIDDRVELAARLHADGVHLGKADMPVREARRLLGPGFLIGGTANTFEDVLLHYEGGADYIGCGPFRYTATKQKLAPVLGLEGYRTLIARMRAEGIVLPVVGIGGVTAGDMASLAEAGLGGIALSGSVLRAADPVDEMRRVMQIAKQVSDNHGRQDQN